jgi:CRP-like cAMP-binding protein
MFVICRGELEALNNKGDVLRVMKEGDCFGEIALLLSEKRTATVRAKTACDLFVLDQAYFGQILRDHEQFAKALRQVAKERYGKNISEPEAQARDSI